MLSMEFIIVLLLIVVLLVIVIVVVLTRFIKVTVTGAWLPQRKYFSLNVSFLKMTFYQNTWYLTDLFKENDELDSFLNNMSNVSKNEMERRGIDKDIFFTILDRVVIHKVDWTTYFGTGQASSTGIITGAIQALTETLKVALNSYSHMLCQPALFVVPFYQHKCFKSELHCMFSIRLAKAIFIIIHIFLKNRNKGIISETKI